MGDNKTNLGDLTTDNGLRTTDNIHRVLVTSGPTRAYIDRIRYITNTSSGALGARIVEALISRGFPVTHIYGAGSEQPDVQNSSLIESLEVITVDDLSIAVKEVCARGDISAVVHAMAVLDYAPESSLETKKKSGGDFWDIRLVRTPKIISVLREIVPGAFTVGFKLEAGISDKELICRADVLLKKYGLDAVVANDLDRVNEIRHDAVIIGPGKKIIARCETKEEIAGIVTEMIATGSDK